MQLEPKRGRLTPKPGPMERRRLRSTVDYRQIRRLLGTSHSETLLLLSVGDLQTATAGGSVSGASWSQTHVVVGLSAGLAVDQSTTTMGPWMIQDPDYGGNAYISYSGLVLFIDRRHWRLVWASVFGRVEQIAPGVGVAKRSHRPLGSRRRKQQAPTSIGAG